MLILLGLVVLGVGGGIALTKKPAIAPPKAPLPPAEPPRPAALRGGLQGVTGSGPLNQLATSGKTLLAGAGGLAALTGTSAAAVGSVAAAGAAAAGLGYLVTGDVGGAIGGVYGLAAQVNGGPGIIGAQAGNVGRVVGREIDRLLGGDGNSGTGIVYQSAGFVGGMAISCWGLAAVPGVGQLFLLIVGIGSAISDSNRLAYGQAGARADALKTLQASFETMLNRMEFECRRALVGDTGPTPTNLQQLAEKAALLPKLSDDEKATVRAYAAATALGMALEENETKRRVHNLSAWGIGVTSAAYHEKYAADRGVFVVDTSELEEFGRRLGGPSAIYAAKISAREPALRAKGAWLVNVRNWFRVMNEPWGLGVNAGGHAKYWAQRGAFVGYANPTTGDLESDVHGSFGWEASKEANAPICSAGPTKAWAPPSAADVATAKNALANSGFKIPGFN